MTSPRISAQDYQEYCEVFKLADADGSGEITKEELLGLFRMIGLKITPDELASIVADETDPNGSSDINLDRFIGIMSKRINAGYTREEVKSSFKLFVRDRGMEGAISIRDLETSLQMYGTQRLLPSEAKNLCNQLESTDGRFNYSEFVNRMMLE